MHVCVVQDPAGKSLYPSKSLSRLSLTQGTSFSLMRVMLMLDKPLQSPLIPSYLMPPAAVAGCRTTLKTHTCVEGEGSLTCCCHPLPLTGAAICLGQCHCKATRSKIITVSPPSENQAAPQATCTFWAVPGLLSGSRARRAPGRCSGSTKGR